MSGVIEAIRDLIIVIFALVIFIVCTPTGWIGLIVITLLINSFGG